ncbi:MAG: hypothetical protein ACE3JK_08195 [Sporolactobacillus sp.]
MELYNIKGVSGLESLLERFNDFLNTEWENMSIYEKRIGNLILSNFQDICSLNSRQGKRGKFIGKLIFDSKDKIINRETVNTTSIISQSIKGISKLTVGNFRGFSTEEVINLNKKYIFVYGRNGTGKSSLCEALEYSFLGDIEECEAKRMKLGNYIKNIYTKKGEFPKLQVITKDDKQEILKVNKSKYFFAFVERNRIEKFARINAETVQFQQQRLSSLFGLDKWNEFVHEFNINIDNYLMDNGEAQAQTREAVKELEQIEKFINGFGKNFDEIKKSSSKILSKYKSITNSTEFIRYLDGNNEKPGRLDTLARLITDFSNLNLENVDLITSTKTEIKAYSDNMQLLTGLQQELSDYKGKMSLKELYEGILKAKLEFGNYCPGCHSQIYDDENNLLLPVNPFENADTQLKKLLKGIKLEKAIEKVKKSLISNLREVILKIHSITALVRKIKYTPDQDFKALEKNINALMDSMEFNNLHFFEDFLVELGKINTKLVEYNDQITIKKERLNKIKKEKTDLQKDKDQILGLISKYKLLDEQKKESLKNIRSATKNVNQLKVKSDIEIIYNDIYLSYREAYKSLRDRLMEYTVRLPIILVDSLEEKALKIYNFINDKDLESEKLDKLILPKQPNEKINIYLKGKPKESIDALLYLSEGHLRCLGLAILLAKNIYEKLPLVIFDDVINAIDDEHRKSIADLIIDNDELKDKQWVVTTHGEEFIKLLDNKVSHENIKSNVIRIDFRRKKEPEFINMVLDDDRNYIKRARTYFEQDRFRESLAECRRGIEALGNTIWKKYYRLYAKAISIKLTGRDFPPESRAIFDTLIKALKKEQVPEFKNTVNLMEQIIEKGNDSPIIWKYMNKGTHEEERDEEFIEEVVSDIIKILEELDIEINDRIHVNNSGKLSYLIESH